MQKEYWVNVYKDGKGIGLFHHDKGMARALANDDVIYRIHVKMDGGYNRYLNKYRELFELLNKSQDKPTYKYLEKGDWMG